MKWTLKTNRIPKGRLMKKVKIKEESIIGVRPAISPGRIFRKNRRGNLGQLNLNFEAEILPTPPQKSQAARRSP